MIETFHLCPHPTRVRLLTVQADVLAWDLICRVVVSSRSAGAPGPVLRQSGGAALAGQGPLYPFYDRKKRKVGRRVWPVAFAEPVYQLLSFTPREEKEGVGRGKGGKREQGEKGPRPPAASTWLAEVRAGCPLDRCPKPAG